jgi:hypothetical protein
MADTIVIRTANPKDITIEETEGIAKAVRDLDLNCDVKVEGQQRTGYGVTLFEVLRISLVGGALWASKALAEEAAKKIMAVVVDWVRERFKGRRSGSKRPVYVAIYGPDGTIKSVVIKNGTDELEDRTEQDQQMEKNLRERK